MRIDRCSQLFRAATKEQSLQLGDFKTQRVNQLILLCDARLQGVPIKPGSVRFQTPILSCYAPYAHDLTYIYDS